MIGLSQGHDALFFGVVNTRFKTANIEVEVTYKKAGNKLLTPRPKIVLRADGVDVHQERVVADRRFLCKGKEVIADIFFRDPEDEDEEVSSSEVIELLLKYKYKYLNEQGVEVEKKDIRYFAVQPDGTENEVAPFSRTSVIDIPEENWVAAANVNGFIYESIYEIFPETKKGEIVSEKDATALWNEAELRWKKDQVGITTFSWGRGFKQLYAFLIPIVKEGKYVWIMKLSNTELEFRYLQDIPEKVEVREVPTLKMLPPIPALVVAATRAKRSK